MRLWLKTCNMTRYLLAHELKITPIKDPVKYVKDIQTNFDDRKIEFGNEYCDALGIE